MKVSNLNHSRELTNYANLKMPLPLIKEEEET